jgi:hypothetical protein
MKTLKFFIALCIVLTSASIDVNAQNQNGVIKTTMTNNMGGQYLECTKDYLWGDVTIEVMIMPNHILTRSKKFEAKGYTDKDGLYPSGNIYEFNQIESISSDFENWVTTGVIFLNGKNIAVFQWHFHLTTNANGEPTAEFFTHRMDCK